MNRFTEGINCVTVNDRDNGIRDLDGGYYTLISTPISIYTKPEKNY